MATAIKNYEVDEGTVTPLLPAGFRIRCDVSPRLKSADRDCRCPSCGSIVYSRRHEICSVCGEHLPESCRFTQREARRIESLFETERARHRGWLRKLGYI